jgi:hypothetical protein
MSAADVDAIKYFVTALEDNDYDLAADYLTDDFHFSGWTPDPLDKDGFMGMIQGLKEGIPGLIFNLHNLQELSNRIAGIMQVVGYQTGAFNLPQLSLPPIPQRARSVSLPTEDVEFLMENEHIRQWRVQRVEGGGIKGLLHQLGVDVPMV